MTTQNHKFIVSWDQGGTVYHVLFKTKTEAANRIEQLKLARDVYSVKLYVKQLNH